MVLCSILPYIYTHTHTGKMICESSGLCSGLFTDSCVCTQVHTYACAYMPTHTHTHTYICIYIWNQMR